MSQEEGKLPPGLEATLAHIVRERTPTHGIDPERAADWYDCMKEGPGCVLGTRMKQLEDDMEMVRTTLAEQRGKADRDRWILKVMMAAIGVVTVVLGAASLTVNLLKRGDVAQVQAAQAEVLHRLQVIQAEVGK